MCGQCDLCGGELRRGERYYRISGENGVQGLPGRFRGADTGGVDEVVGGEADA